MSLVSFGGICKETSIGITVLTSVPYNGNDFNVTVLNCLKKTWNFLFVYPVMRHAKIYIIIILSGLYSIGFDTPTII